LLLFKDLDAVFDVLPSAESSGSVLGFVVVVSVGAAEVIKRNPDAVVLLVDGAFIEFGDDA